jgi:hypothetical protein
MTQQEILDYNKKCAEFMYPYAKAEYESGKISVDDGLYKKGLWVFGHYDLMRYHSDWNWIMEVVDKINSLPLDYPTYDIQHLEMSTSKEAVIQVISKFLILYNESKIR